jgi:hypothetical protein
MAKDELKKTHETWKEKKYVYLSYMLFVWKISEIGFPFPFPFPFRNKTANYYKKWKKNHIMRP